VIHSESLTIRVTDIEALSPTLKRLRLVRADGGLLPISQPGAHLSLTLPGENGGHHNSYSIISACDDRTAYQVIVRQVILSRGGSRFIHHALRVGDVLQASTPNSQFTLQPRARKHLLIGGGVGITPLLSFLRELRRRAVRLEFHQFAQTVEVPVFQSLLAPFAGHDVWVHPGRAAFDLAHLLKDQPLGTHLYCCGPPILLEAVQAAATALGWPPTSLHSESFAVSGGEPFVVRLARHGGEVAVGEHESMLEALENAGLSVAFLCRGGACGACLTAVVDGVPDHRDHVLSDAEKARGRLVMPCVSRAKTAYLTLDL
jgi:ferredoxin-NADP reductase